MPPGSALLVVLMLGVGYSVYEGAVKPAAVKVAHVTKVTGKTVLHLVTFGHR